MKRLCFLVLLTLLSSSAQAGNSLSFSIGGHRIHIESSQHCRSASCASVSISGLSRSSRPRGDADRDTAETDRSVTPAATTIVPAPALASLPQVQPPPAPPAVYRPAAVETQPAAAPPPPAQSVAVVSPEPPTSTPVAVPPALPPPPPVEIVRSGPPPQISPAWREMEDDPSIAPVGDWQTEGRGLVRVVKCGRALCGYVLNASGEENGEAVLVNMKPKSGTRWTGSVYSQDSGDTYYGTMELKGANNLRIQACALGRFYCSGNNWTRVGGSRLITSNRVVREPRS